MIEVVELKKLYLQDGLSAAQIAEKFSLSQNAINYWLAKHEIQKRSISEALYLKLNPNGDPFCYQSPSTTEEWMLFGLGIGLFWGEGNKRSKSSVRLGNIDPGLIRNFLKFLDKIFSIDKKKLRFGLQIFSDTSPKVARRYWEKELHLSSSQFQKVIVTPARSPGTYKHKSEYGVLTVNFSNTKLKKIMDGLIENLSSL
ncbi:MAG TPA: hypothetical protein VJI73_04335 [Candidatus Paceibacterota bacterium]